MGKVVGLFLYEEKGAVPLEVETARRGPKGEFEGDHHGTRSGREILVVDRDVLDDHGLKPGALREQVTFEGFPQLNTLSHGSKLRVGDAVLEIVDPCGPCLKIGAYNGVEDVEAFRESLEGRRGVFVKFVEEDADSEIKIGDPVELI
jgi:MOSC domain-containing protein YiiM